MVLRIVWPWGLHKRAILCLSRERCTPWLNLSDTNGTQCSSPPSEIVLDLIGELSRRFNGHVCGLVAKTTKVSVESCDTNGIEKYIFDLTRDRGDLFFLDLGRLSALSG